MEIKRRLATIEKISEISSIDGADMIENATIRGWNVVVKKGEFKPGDLCVYCEIDSLMPEREEFEFLRPRNFRIKTIKLRSQISQGIIFPLEILNIAGTYGNVIPIVEGEDVTDLLGIKKYEAPIPAELSGIVKGSFPSHSVKTDEERIQNLVDCYDQYKKETWIATEKLDGCLDGDTFIETEDGIKTIREICESKYTGKIKSFNLNTNEIIYTKIIGHSIKQNDKFKTRLTSENVTKKWFDIELETGKHIRLTENHEIWLPELMCWRRADELDGTEEVLVRN